MGEAPGTQPRNTSSQRSGVEEQVDNLLEMFEDQEAQVWAYVFGAIIAILIGLVVAYYAAQSMRENRKSTIERLRDSVREGLHL